MNNIKNVKPNKKVTFSQGYFIPQNPLKYVGDLSKIIYRSSWEKKFMVLCDKSDIVVKWASEPFHIKYFSPIDEKFHKYYIDFFCSLRTTSNEIKNYLIEIKPKNQAILTLKEAKTFKSKEKYMDHLKTVIINHAKWAAADSYAKNIGFEFKVWTEENLNIL